MARKPPARPGQLNLALPLPAAMGRADFLEAPANALALTAIEAPEGLPLGRLLLIGPAGAGKTHLARIWAARTGAHWLPVRALCDEGAALLACPALLSALVIDDAHLARGAGEETLFHLYNHLGAVGGQLLLTAPVPVRDWGLALPDLVSRLNSVASVALQAPDDALLAALLVKLFNDRQIRVEPALIDYLLGRMERSAAAAVALVDALDARGLALGRAVTPRLARDLFGDPSQD
jgi:chromosomal replication initiation ATPase DnaA